VKKAPTMSAEMTSRKPRIRVMVAVSAVNPGEPS
jgi:hypothetical protein